MTAGLVGLFPVNYVRTNVWLNFKQKPKIKFLCLLTQDKEQQNLEAAVVSRKQGHQRYNNMEENQSYKPWVMPVNLKQNNSFH
jgi:hypothetical protein